jgi:superfamily II DNA or RNA helicase
MLRLILPPNLAAAAGRNAIAVQVRVDLDRPPGAEWLPALAALQRLGAPPQRSLVLQLTREQLRELVTLLRGMPAFAWANEPDRPLLWVGDILRGVSEHLLDASATATPHRSLAAPTPALRGTGLGATPAASTRRTPSAERSLTAAASAMVVDGSEQFLAITLPSREHASYATVHALLRTHGFALEPSNRRWWLRDRHKVLNFLAEHGQQLRDDFRAEFTENFTRNTGRLIHAGVLTEARATADGFEVTLGLDVPAAAAAAVQAALASHRHYVDSGSSVLILEPQVVARVRAAQQALAGERGAGGTVARRTHRILAARLPEVESVLGEIAPHFAPPEAWRERSAALRDLSILAPVRVPEPLGSTLRPYQRLGVAWLHHLHRHGLGGILADEMGLGKTLQALGLACATLADGGGTVLVVCPASLLENWRREAARFAPHLRVRVHHGQGRHDTPDGFHGVDLIITSYGTLVRDQARFTAIEFTCVIGDEAQHLKSRRSQNAQAMRSLRARGRFLLTGTPVENSLEDLRSLFEVLMPGLLSRPPTGARGEEKQWYDDRLRAQVAPYILRRTKAAVAPELPARIEQVLWCELTGAQAEAYRRIQEEGERSLMDLQAGGAGEATLRLAALTQLLRLRQACCDLRLLPEQNLGAAPNAADSAKLEAFRELLAEALDDGHRILVFSQFTSLLALLRADLEAQEIPYCSLDGSMSPSERQAAVDRFQNDPAKVPVFLLSLKAGGTGLNLTGADTVVHFDPWWNPAAEAQATDRAHRIGQTRVVTSYKLICTGTVEEKVLGLQERKRALLADVFEASDAAASRLSLDDLRDLLR